MSRYLKKGLIGAAAVTMPLLLSIATANAQELGKQISPTVNIPFLTNTQNFSISLEPNESRYAYDSLGNEVTIEVAQGQEVHFGDTQSSSSGSSTPDVGFQLVNVDTGAVVLWSGANDIYGNFSSSEGFCYPYPSGWIPAGVYFVRMTNLTTDTITGNGYGYYG